MGVEGVVGVVGVDMLEESYQPSKKNEIRRMNGGEIKLYNTCCSLCCSYLLCDVLQYANVVIIQFKPPLIDTLSLNRTTKFNEFE